MQTKWIEPSRVYAARRSKTLVRNPVNAAADISPERHGELAVAGAPLTGHMPVDRHVIGRVRKDHVRLLGIAAGRLISRR